MPTAMRRISRMRRWRHCADGGSAGGSVTLQGVLSHVGQEAHCHLPLVARLASAGRGAADDGVTLHGASIGQGA